MYERKDIPSMNPKQYETTPSGDHEACGLPAGVGWSGYDCELPKGHTSKKHGFRSDHGWISWEQ